jgi:hypothetical protein
VQRQAPSRTWHAFRGNLVQDTSPPRRRQPSRASHSQIPGRPRLTPRRPRQPGGHSEGPNTRSHPELGRENPQRRWYCVLRRGRAGRRQALATPATRISSRSRTRPNPSRQFPHPTPAGWSSPVARQAHNLKVVGSNPTPATKCLLKHNVLRQVPEAAAVSGFAMSDRCPKNARPLATDSDPLAPVCVRSLTGKVSGAKPAGKRRTNQLNAPIAIGRFGPPPTR